MERQVGLGNDYHTGTEASHAKALRQKEPWCGRSPCGSQAEATGWKAMQVPDQVGLVAPG